MQPRSIERLLTAMRVPGATFNSVAACLVDELVPLTEACISNSTFAEHGSVTRAMVHLRPAHGYRGLYVQELGADASHSDPAIRPSASTWQHLNNYRCPLAVDVLSGHAHCLDDSGDELELRGSIAFDSENTVYQLRTRSTTHLLAIPISIDSETIEGMVSIEVSCRQAIGRDFVWRECIKDMVYLTDVAALRMPGLPIDDHQEITSDPSLPVMGTHMRELAPVLRAFSQQNETMLLTGQTGVGKTQMAYWIHQQSRRREQPFEVLDLMTVSSDLQLAMLTGWKKGAFTSAIKDTAGALARTKGGTLMIDEIDKLSLDSQAGLLRLLDTGNYRVPGDDQVARQANVRFIIGTNANLKEAVENGTFRSDLYYRINVLRIHLPELRDRADEIAGWASHFARRCHQEAGHTSVDCIIDSAATALLESQPWPGNLRELDNVVRRAYALSSVTESDRHPHFIGQVHVRLAMGLDHDAPSASSISELLQQAGDALLRVIKEKSTEDAAVNWRQEFNILYCFVFAAAMKEQQGNLQQVANALDQAQAYRQRNFSQRARNDLEKLRAFYTLLDCPMPEYLARFLLEI